MLYLLDWNYHDSHIQSVLPDIKDRYLLLMIALVEDTEDDPEKQEQLIKIKAKIDRSLPWTDFSNQAPEMVMRIINKT
jgi:hypothetical protein